LHGKCRKLTFVSYIENGKVVFSESGNGPPMAIAYDHLKLNKTAHRAKGRPGMIRLGTDVNFTG
jgi:hypothetical protein